MVWQTVRKKTDEILGVSRLKRGFQVVTSKRNLWHMYLILMIHCIWLFSLHYQIKNLQTEVASLKREDIETPKAITADLEELRSMCCFVEIYHLIAIVETQFFRLQVVFIAFLTGLFFQFSLFCCFDNIWTRPAGFSSSHSSFQL